MLKGNCFTGNFETETAAGAALSKASVCRPRANIRDHMGRFNLGTTNPAPLARPSIRARSAARLGLQISTP